MGISFKIDAEEGIIYAIAEGTIGLKDFLAHRKNVRDDPDFSPRLVHIFEFRMSGMSITDSEAQSLAADIPPDPTRKVAMVAVGHNRDWALRFKEMVKDVPVEVFSDLGSAKKWITSD